MFLSTNRIFAEWVSPLTICFFSTYCTKLTRAKSLLGYSYTLWGNPTLKTSMGCSFVTISICDETVEDLKIDLFCCPSQTHFKLGYQ